MLGVELIDTHCHIQEIGFKVPDGSEHTVANRWQAAGIVNQKLVVSEAQKTGVSEMICVGCNLQDSYLAVETAAKFDSVWASIGIHPHEAAHYLASKKSKLQQELNQLVKSPRVVAIGECGLDYFYEFSSRSEQLALLETQLQVAVDTNLPVIFHVRDVQTSRATNLHDTSSRSNKGVWADFWPLLDNFPGLRGVLHSFTDTRQQMDRALERDLFIGLNGIMTFTKNPDQLAMAQAVPLQKLLLETDAPFLTPKPLRGTICQPQHVLLTAEFLSDLRGESLDALAKQTSANARLLFGLGTR